MTNDSFNPVLGMLLAVISGAMGGSFYVPFGGVKQWSWEIYWLLMGLVSWMIVPVLVAWLTVPMLPKVLFDSPVQSLVLAYLFGAMFGVGAVTFGLTVRYLGISLGMAMIMGLGTAFATLIPPIVDGQFGNLLVTQSGTTVLLGVTVCLIGIAVCGYAGVCKDRELTDEQKAMSVRDFALVKGFVVAAICAVTSCGTIYGINAGRAIGQVAVDLGTPDAYRNNAVLMIVLVGGFTVNSCWCLMLGIKNRSVSQYVAGPGTLLLANYLLVVLAALLWYGQMFLYGVSRTKMGVYDFASWALVMAFTITSSTLWGLVLKEWKGVGRRTLLLLGSGILVLILSAVITGIGSHLATAESPSHSQPLPKQARQDRLELPNQPPFVVCGTSMIRTGHAGRLFDVKDVLDSTLAWLESRIDIQHLAEVEQRHQDAMNFRPVDRSPVSRTAGLRCVDFGQPQLNDMDAWYSELKKNTM